METFDFTATPLPTNVNRDETNSVLESWMDTNTENNIWNTNNTPFFLHLNGLAQLHHCRLRISDRARGRRRNRRRLCLFLLSKPVHVESVSMSEGEDGSGRDGGGVPSARVWLVSPSRSNW